MDYEINVSKNGKHYFATHARSIRGRQHANDILADFSKRFPKKEGFELELLESETITKVVKVPFTIVGA